MTPHTCAPGLTRQAPAEPRPGAGSPAVPAVPAPRCADSARARGAQLAASAVRYSRFLLLEVPGPWGASALDGAQLDAGVAGELGRVAAAADASVLLIRRHGRRPADGPRGNGPAGNGPGANGPLAWAVADTSPGAERVRWGSWRDPADLLGLDLAAPLPRAARATGQITITFL